MRTKRLSTELATVMMILTFLLFATAARATTHESVLHAFNPSAGAAQPYAGLITDGAGNRYGTTYAGGTYNVGTVFELKPRAGGWTEQVLYSFNNNGTDGTYPYGGLIFDRAGNLYGTTSYGGTQSWGTVFELTPSEGGAWTEQVIYTFCTLNNCDDGAEPEAGLIIDASGNLYGTTSGGGAYYSSGTVFELMPSAGGGWTEQVLHSFSLSGSDGYGPSAGLTMDAAGNLYGTTTYGGAVFELTPGAGGGWTFEVLYRFCTLTNCEDGDLPEAGLILDAAGNLYGTTYYGGTYYNGAVFELEPSGAGGWTEQVLYSFKGQGTDGGNPYAGLIFDRAGNLYGTTSGGGTHGNGTVFGLTPSAGGAWTEQVLHSFSNDGIDGVSPHASLIMDAAGNLYGTTSGGGAYYSSGTVFELMPSAGGGWTEQVLINFSLKGTDGGFSYAGLILDAAGNLYGTTSEGGAAGRGTVFELMPNGSGGWTEQVLHSFCAQANCADGAGLYDRLIFDSAGNLYGTTHAGGTHGYGTVFELKPTSGGGWTDQVLHNFERDGTDGIWPYAGLIIDAAGNLYGTTYQGGTYNYGAVFELTPSGGGGWTDQVLYSFNPNNGTDGAYAYAGLTWDAAGNLYGTTTHGGTYNVGTVFELTPSGGGGWTEQVLWSFGGGAYPYGRLVFDRTDNLYGTTYWGGDENYGEVFKLTPSEGGGWTGQVIYSFGNQGDSPHAGLIFDRTGNLYGTTSAGGTEWGTVFELTPSGGGGWTEQTLYNFSGTDGAFPLSSLVIDAAGNLYGTTSAEGPYGYGTVFEITP